jgi:Flp pilus assembly protein TadD
MSLLLDALKKSGNIDSSGRATSGNLSEMSLEELPAKPTYSMPSTQSTVASPPPSTVNTPTPRSTGENLFAAKRAPAMSKKFQYNLGIVPTALIIGTILGAGYGTYVWYELQPPKPINANNTPRTDFASAAPAPRPAPPPAPLALPPEPPSAIEAAPQITPPRSESMLASRNTSTSAPTVKRTPRAPSTGGIQIQRQMGNDTTFTALTEAYQAYQTGDFVNASQRYLAVLRKDSKNRDALLGMAAISQQQGQDNAAIQYYKQVLLLDPRDPAAQAGMSAFATGDAADKESRLKQSITQSPQSAVLHFALGNMYTEQSRWGDAQQAYFNAFRLEPANAQFAFHLATSLDHLGQNKLAAQYYGQALQLDTNKNAGFDHSQTEQRKKKLQLAP